MQSTAKKHGVWVSRPGNGICHTVHTSRFAKLMEKLRTASR